ncbi:hypothetical protein Q1695_006970 [Nippostrongylus brasiliensis]|nr:hypothetical protein Q1695_006970 [Nippostrongylus brasiliensis]
MIIGFSFSPAAVTEDNGDVGFFVSGRINLHGVCSYLVHGSSINDVEGNGNSVDIPDIVRRDVKGLILHELPEVAGLAAQHVDIKQRLGVTPEKLYACDDVVTHCEAVTKEGQCNGFVL